MKNVIDQVVAIDAFREAFVEYYSAARSLAVRSTELRRALPLGDRILLRLPVGLLGGELAKASLQVTSAHMTALKPELRALSGSFGDVLEAGVGIAVAFDALAEDDAQEIIRGVREGVREAYSDDSPFFKLLGVAEEAPALH